MGGDVSEGRTACAASDWRTWNDVAGSCFLCQGGKKSAASTHENTPTNCAGTSGVGGFLRAQTLTEGYSARNSSQRR